MQSFKQYLLKEETTEEKLAFLQFLVSYDDELPYDSPLIAKIKNSIENLKIPGLKVEYHTTDAVNMTLFFSMNWLKSNQPKLKEYVIKILHTIYPLIKPMNVDMPRTRSELNLHYVPDFVVEWADITLSPKPNASLKDIHKFIKCEYLTIEPADNVKSNVLGLLKMDCEVEIWGGEWTSIVKKFLKSKDIIACQEELIDNGLKDFAEL